MNSRSDLAILRTYVALHVFALAVGVTVFIAILTIVLIDAPKIKPPVPIKLAEVFASNGEAM